MRFPSRRFPRSLLALIVVSVVSLVAASAVQAAGVKLDTSLTKIGVDLGPKTSVNIDLPAVGVGVDVGVDQGGAEVNLGLPGTEVNVGVGNGGGSGEQTSSGTGSGSGSESGSESSGADEPSRGSTGDSPKGETSSDAPQGESGSGDPAAGGDSSENTSSTSGGKSGDGAANGSVTIDPVTGEPVTDGQSANQDSNVVSRIVERIPPWMRVALGAMLLIALFFAFTTLRERRRRRRVERESGIDALTGAANRKAFETEVAREWSRARRHGHGFGLLLIDLDGFKRVNDTHGHIAGDRVLKEVAALLSDQMRTSDTVARIGGDEFAVICPETDMRGLVGLREQLEAWVEEGLDDHVGLSVGIAEYRATDEAAQAMQARADASMYRRKRTRLHAVGAAAATDDAPPRERFTNAV